MRTRLVFSLLLLPMVVAGCTRPLPPPDSSQRLIADEALQELRALDTQQLLETFAVAANVPHSRHAWQETRSAAGVTYSSRVSDSVANFGFLAEAMIPEDPPYLSERFRDEFEYRTERDTALWGRPAHIITVAARPGAKQETQVAHYTVDVESGQLTGLVLHGRIRNWMYRERSRYEIQLRPGPDDAWVPFQVSSAVDMVLARHRSRAVTRRITFFGYAQDPR